MSTYSSPQPPKPPTSTSFTVTRLGEQHDPSMQPSLHSMYHSPQAPSLNILELETSIRNSSRKSQSVADKINKMEEFYVDRIRQLQFKIRNIEDEKEELQEKVAALADMLEREREERAQIQRLREDTRKLKEEQRELGVLEDFRRELEERLTTQKHLRIQLQDQNSKLLDENTHIREAYKQSVENYRRLLRSDLDRIQREVPSPTSTQTTLRAQIQHTRRQSKKLKEGDKLLTQELIPEVKKEIKSIKKKLNSL